MKPNTNKFLLSVLQTYLLASNQNTMPPQDASTETMTTTPPSKRIKSVVVVRHGERLDYVMRDAGQNWIPTSERPWDPPLTDVGHQQAQALGEALPDLLRALDLPPIAAVYSSPFYRCRQTAVGLLAATTTSSSSEDQLLRVKVELGLAESLNENFYRSWAVPGTDGSWGFQEKELPLAELDIESLHPASKEPVQAILDWNQQQGGTDESTTISPRMVDQDHKSKTTLDTPYSMHPPKFESMKVQRDRMAQTLHQLSDDHENETIVLVSHGGPVTHLYESLTGNHWNVHGVGKYCCYSIYQKHVVAGEEKGEEMWTPLVVNQVLGEEAKTKEDEASNTTFTWA